MCYECTHRNPYDHNETLQEALSAGVSLKKHRDFLQPDKSRWKGLKKFKIQMVASKIFVDLISTESRPCKVGGGGGGGRSCTPLDKGEGGGLRENFFRPFAPQFGPWIRH